MPVTECSSTAVAIVCNCQPLINMVVVQGLIKVGEGLRC